jgi:hypothetical protein
MSSDSATSPDLLGWVLLAVVAVITVVGYPLVGGRSDGEVVNAWHVWYFGWLTAVSTGTDCHTQTRRYIVSCS